MTGVSSFLDVNAAIGGMERAAFAAAAPPLPRGTTPPNYIGTPVVPASLLPRAKAVAVVRVCGSVVRCASATHLAALGSWG